jgi:RNA polymerase sigma factor (sigma-70 family)
VVSTLRMADLSEDERLVADALAGDPKVRRQLATRLLGSIQREVVGVLRRAAAPRGRDPRQEVQELTQDVLVLLFERDGQELRRWDPQRGRSLDSFVRLVARRRAARILDQGRGNPWADDPIDPTVVDAEAPGDGDLARNLEERSMLGRVLDRLYAQMSPRDLELFQLLFVDERDPQEVADLLGMTRGAVNAWSYRTRKLARHIAASSLGDSVNQEQPDHG